ncbi:Chaperone protein DnaJ [Bienertia sinuspersici]
MAQGYYKILELDYDTTDEDIRLNYRRLALVSIHLPFLTRTLFVAY